MTLTLVFFVFFFSHIVFRNAGECFYFFWAGALAVFEVVILLPRLAAGSLLLSTSVSCALSASFESGVCF